MNTLISPPFQARIEIYKLLPNVTNWEDIHSLLIPGSFTTIWQVIVQDYPNFPKIGRRTDEYGTLIQDWTEIPTVEMIESVLTKINCN